MSLIVRNEIIRLDSVYKLTVSKYTFNNPKNTGGEIYVHYKSVDKEDKTSYYMFSCQDKPGIIEQIKKDVSVIFTASGIYNLEEIVNNSIDEFCKKDLEKNYMNTARNTLLAKLNREPTDQEIMDEVALVKYRCEPKPVG